MVWAARFYTGLLNKLTPKGVVFSFLACNGIDPCTKLLQETIEWLARPENYDPDRTPPGLEGFDPVPFLLSSLPITASVMATQFVHELGHRVVAFRKKVCYAKLLSFQC